MQQSTRKSSKSSGANHRDSGTKTPSRPQYNISSVQSRPKSSAAQTAPTAQNTGGSSSSGGVRDTAVPKSKPRSNSATSAASAAESVTSLAKSIQSDKQTDKQSDKQTHEAAAAAIAASQLSKTMADEVKLRVRKATPKYVINTESYFKGRPGTAGKGGEHK